MKYIAVSVLCGLLAAPAVAVQPVTIAEAEQRLQAERGKTDRKIAHLLEDLELTERCSAACLARWEAMYPGSKTHDALVALADAAVGLSLPAAELPPDPAPSLEEQQRIVRLAVQYVVTTTHALPNFLATRQTVYYEDAPPQEMITSNLLRELEPGMERMHSLYVVARGRSNITYREGQEVPDQRSDARRQSEDSFSHLTTNGEFGPILKIVIVDAARGQVQWSHWEHGSGGLEAHFRFSVPAASSHYLVNYDCGQGGAAHWPGYSGEFAVDPATGAILRIAFQSVLPAPCSGISSSIATEFGPVELGGRTYICPKHSVSIFRFPFLLPPSLQRPELHLRVTEMNDVTFTGYRLFRSSSRIVSVGGDPLP